MSRFVHISVIALLILGTAAAIGARAWRMAHALPPEAYGAISARLEEIPLRTSDPVFEGVRETLPDRIVDLSGAEHYASIVYTDVDGGVIRLHVGAATGTSAWLHEPTVCLPSHGWTTSETVKVPLWSELPGASPDAQIWRMTLHKAGEQLLVYYWFQWGEHLLTTRRERRWLRFQNLLAGEMDRPIQIVILYAPIRGQLAAAEDRVESLVRAIWPNLTNVLTPGAHDHAASPP